VVTFSAYHLMGIDAAKGTLLWSQLQDNYPPEKRLPGYGDTHSNTVLYEKGFIYYAAGDGNCGVKLKLSDDGMKVTELWRNKNFDSYMGGIVKMGDYLYGCGTVRPDLLSINTTTGVLTDSLRVGTGAVIAADNMLYYYTQKGDMMLLSYNQGKIKKVSSFRIIEGTLQHFFASCNTSGCIISAPRKHPDGVLTYTESKASWAKMAIMVIKAIEAKKNL